MMTSPEYSEFSEDDNNLSEDDPDSIIYQDIDQWLEQLRRSDRSLYNLMALEVWSIARTMDDILPGFWNRFMKNRQVALKEFVKYRKTNPTEHFLSNQENTEYSYENDD